MEAHGIAPGEPFGVGAQIEIDHRSDLQHYSGVYETRERRFPRIPANASICGARCCGCRAGGTAYAG